MMSVIKHEMIVQTENSQVELQHDYTRKEPKNQQRTSINAKNW